jgi:CRISPR-associated endonuclease/helicase Cas3
MTASADTRFWGKYDEKTGKSLSILAHSLDVAVVFRALCDLNGIRRSLSRSTRTLLMDEHMDRLAVLALHHDIGKMNLGFQDKILSEEHIQAGHIRELAPLFREDVLRDKFLEALHKDIPTWFSSAESADSYFYAIFSHHGRPVRFHDTSLGNYWLARDKWWRPDSSRDPIQAIAEISAFAEKAFPKAFERSVGHLPDEPQFHHRFAGLVMLADWIGSHSHWFPLERVTAEQRLAYDREAAPRALIAIGMNATPLRPILASVGDDFRTRFNMAPLPLQEAVDGLSPDTPENRLMIAESATGSGKTEAALNWFCKLFAAGKVDSLYFALPTRVAARELYERVDRIIKGWFVDADSRPVTVLAVPGYVQIDGQPPTRVLPEVDDANLWQDCEKVHAIERQWAGAMPKRFLAATVAVGTIDQALLSIVQASHAHLRSVCLDRSLLVVDEVHASDLYMSRLLRALLSHHLMIGGYAMLLSATLGSRAVTEYVQLTKPNVALPGFDTAIRAPYPSLTLSTGKTISTSSTDRTKEVRFDLREWAFCPEKAIDEIIAPALEAGARVLVVLNTVDRAIRMFRAVESSSALDGAWLFRCRGQACPHHGRFAPEDRAVLDKATSVRMGKGTPPGPVLLIGTQTLEQSLDIDADLLITDLAPSDVLLQRVGRLHRHNRTRPPGYENARCVVLVPDRSLETGLDSRGEVSGDFKRIGYGSVYEDLRSLEMTYRTLHKRPTVVIPQDNRFLVERATHPEVLNSLVGKRWESHRDLVSGRGIAKEIAASTITNAFDQYLGQFVYEDLGRSVATRLGIDRLSFRLKQPVISPFGETLTHMAIPGQMGPGTFSKDTVINVEGQMDGFVALRCEDRFYQYSRYGLEVVS